MKNLLKDLTVKAVLLAAVVFSAVACAKEDIGGASGNRGGNDVTLRVVVPRPTISTPMTRAGAEDFDRIHDLNIVIANGTGDDAGLFRTVYVNDSYAGTEPDVDFSAGEIHFSEAYSTANSLSEKYIYIVANYGAGIPGDISTVGQLKSLVNGSDDLPGIPSNGSMMFALAESDKDNPTHSHPDTGAEGINLKADLQRTVAMITVEIDGSALAKGVAITPRSVSLHRVPRQCYIGKDNNPLESPIEIVEDGESKGGRGELNWPVIAGTATLNGGTALPWGGPAVTVAGGHEGTDSAPLFMFENLHGADFGASGTDQKGKRPAACPENLSPDEMHAHEFTKTCSYVEVEAYYLRMNEAGSASVYSGTVRFRFFLGENITDDFNVKRNTHYKLTLTLSGYAVTEGGQIDADGELVADNDQATWRVDSELGQASFETGDVILNGSGEYFPVDVNVSEDVTCTISGNNDDTQFLWIYNDDQGQMWSSVAGSVTATISGNRIWLYCEPWFDGAGGFDDETHSRSHRVTLNVYRGSSTSGTPIETRELTVIQYAPIEYTTPTDDPATVDFIQRVFGKNSVTLLIDRVDREAMPWGFDGETLDHNNNDGFQNAFHLIDPNPTDHPGRTHRTFAEKYLPWGKMGGGSAMIYSMSFWKLPTGRPNLNINEMINNPSFPDYNGTPEWTDRYWTLPSIVGWQIIEKAAIAGALDPAHPIVSYLPYWTSNASTLEAGIDDGGTNAYTYQFGRSLHSLRENDTYPFDLVRPRTDKYRFRLISVSVNDNPYN